MSGAQDSQSTSDRRRLRLFAAVDIPAAVRAEIDAAARPLREGAPGLRWTVPDAWHITVVFLGWTDRQLVEAVHDALAGAARSSDPVALGLTGRAGVFGGGRARVLWAGMAPAPGVVDLAERAQRALAPLGFVFEQRPFRAHLTLARAGRGDTVPRGLADVYAGPASSWTATHLGLLESRLSPSGARYQRVAQWPLGAAAPDA